MNFSWLEGSWKSTDSIPFYETWCKENDSTFTGEGFMLSNNERVFAEKLRIERRKNVVIYYVQVENQNKGNTIPFQLTNSDSISFVFENQYHDYPCRISCSIVSGSVPEVNVSGDSLHKATTLRFFRN